jgi:hypothetical protein
VNIPHVPPEIFDSLLRIAQLGYDANDLKAYYVTVLELNDWLANHGRVETPETFSPILVRDDTPPH